MSTALAIAAVTAVLRDRLKDGLVNRDINGVLGNSVTVTTLCPGHVVSPSSPEGPHISLFMYRVTPNLDWHNNGSSLLDAPERIADHPPLALDLHYLLSVDSSGDLHAEILLGYAMQLLHETSVLTRDAIRTALHLSPEVGNALPSSLTALSESGLEDQPELIRLAPQYFNAEEMSNLWMAMRTSYRPSAVYTASAVLIRAAEPVRSSRQSDHSTGGEAGVQVQPGLSSLQQIHTDKMQEFALANQTATSAGSNFRKLRSKKLNGLAQPILPTVSSTQLVLPEQQKSLLQQITAQVKQRLRIYEDGRFVRNGRRDHGLGMAVLFTGESGTGKTMAAQVLANELSLDLYRIDLAAVKSKDIGETEKNLNRIFDAAEESGAVLLFDEADALLGKRSDVKESHDRYANIEVNYLLQRIETYSGLAILSCRPGAELNAAFLRRQHFVVHFP